MKRRKIWVGLGTAVLVTSQVAAHEEMPLPIPGDGVAPAGRHAAAAHRRRHRARRQGKSRRRGRRRRGGERGRRGRQGVLRRGPQAGGSLLSQHRADPRPSPRRRRARAREALGRGAAALPAPVGGDLRQDPGRPEDLRGAAIPRRPQGARPDRQGQERGRLPHRAYGARRAPRRRRQGRQGKGGRLATVRRRHRPRDAALGDGRVRGGDRQGADREARRVPGLPRLRLASREALRDGGRGHRAEGRRGAQGRAGGLRRPEEGLAGAGAAEDAGAGRVAGARRRVADRAAARSFPVRPSRAFMRPRSVPGRLVLALLPVAAVLSAGALARRAAADDALAAWRAAFARPAAIPAPASNPVTPQKVDLGRALFTDTRLSGDGSMACVTCHDPALSFSDGVARRRGHDGEPLPRRTPSLWNLAWGLTFFWDGRAPRLEAQASGPIENRREMGGDIAKAAARLAADPAMAARFAAAFPDDPRVTEDHIRAALASFERTLVSPKTRFDRWLGGDEATLDAEERSGFGLFVGKAGCVACHKGWRFTDEAFHDIGLAGADRGRGAALKLAAADHAFKTPSLRERVWTAPYMHDGSLASLEAVVAHYAEGVVRRPTLSADLPRGLRLGRGGAHDRDRPEGPPVHARRRAPAGRRGSQDRERRHAHPHRAPRRA